MGKRIWKIWLWIKNGKIFIAVTNEENGVLKVYDKDSKLILVRKGLNVRQIRQIEANIMIHGLRKREAINGPFKFL